MAFVRTSSTKLVYPYCAYPKCTATVARVLMTVLPSLSLSRTPPETPVISRRRAQGSGLVVNAPSSGKKDSLILGDPCRPMSTLADPYKEPSHPFPDLPPKSNKVRPSPSSHPFALLIPQTSTVVVPSTASLRLGITISNKGNINTLKLKAISVRDSLYLPSRLHPPSSFLFFFLVFGF